MLWQIKRGAIHRGCDDGLLVVMSDDDQHIQPHHEDEKLTPLNPHSVQVVYRLSAFYSNNCHWQSLFFTKLLHLTDMRVSLFGDQE